MHLSPLSWLQSRRRSPLADLVDAHAEALTRGTPGLDALLARYDRATTAQAGELFSLAERLSQVFIPVRPDERFVRELHKELRVADIPTASLAQRIRHLPRTQLAAAGIGGAATLTVTAGVVWLAWRSEGGLMAALRRRIPAA